MELNIPHRPQTERFACIKGRIRKVWIKKVNISLTHIEKLTTYEVYGNKLDNAEINECQLFLSKADAEDSKILQAQKEIKESAQN